MQEPPHFAANISPDAPPPQPPPPGRRPWWHYGLFGCAGCSTLVLIVGVIFTLYASSFIQSVSKGVGTITQEQVAQQLGTDVPLYPGSQLDEDKTRSLLITIRTLARLTRQADQPVEQTVKGGGLFITKDSPDQVLAFYEEQLPAAGWTKERTRQRAASTQLVYKKGEDYLLLQPRANPPDETAIVLFRGSEGLVRQQESLEDAQTPNK